MGARLHHATRRAAALLTAGLLVLACATTTRRPAATAGTPSDGGADELDGDVASADVDADTEAVTPTDESADETGPCPTNMVLVSTEDRRFCVDKYEASLVEVGEGGGEKPFPHWLPVDGHTVRAISEPGVFPQGYISEVQADDACAASSKRLCSHAEWKSACMGPSKTTFPYGDARQPGVCRDDGKSAVGVVFGARAMTDPVASSVATANGAKGTAKPGTAPTPRRVDGPKGRAAQTTRTRATRGPQPGQKADGGRASRVAARTKTKATSSSSKRGPARASARPASVAPSVWAQLNDPRLGQVDGTLARTGSHDACVSGYGALDMVGNVHEWVKTDPASPRGTFAGGYYLDTAINGDGCQYRTTAHAHDYHDYSTGFRCCADAGPSSP